ncbi:MAG: chromosome segregation protein SMC [Oscillospiraceae bacterium]|nr:chromosome segregation protein SMC [Oscillospiraceae bacterium]
MYLKSIELHGFKSFPDKVKLEFGKGLTAVVGPNGSGKSNIGDAVRWVLGEQSSKTLRGGKMEDVIFGGTEKRSPMSFASVTLNISNEDRTLEIDSDEVSVMRRLWRSGESEYMLNGAQVRLKDVLELFMDTGLGRDGYSIIGQGKVADIISSKSGDRREIFNEAAGISKFRYKKAESERRLASAEENILRLKDILSELEGRVEPLRIQSEKAKKYLKLADERKHLEISVWTNKLEELKSSESDTGNLLLLSQGEYEHLTNEISQCEAEIEELAAKRRQSAAAAEEYRAKIAELTEKSSEAASDIAVYKNNIMHYESEIAEAEKKRQELLDAEKEVEKSISQRLSDSERIKADLKSLNEEVAALEKELTGLNVEENEHESDLNTSRESLNRAYVERSELKFAIANALRDKSDAENELKDASAQIDTMKLQITKTENDEQSALDGVSDILKQISEHQNRLSGFNMLYQKKTEQQKKLSQEFNDAELNKRSLESRRQMLIDLENSMEGFAGSVKSVVKAGKSGRLQGVRGTVSQLVSADPKYSLAIETALGGAMQNVVVSNEESAKACIRYLKETNGGRATFLPITSVKGNVLNERGLDMEEGFVAMAYELLDCDEEYSGIIKSLLGRTAVAENIDLAANIAKKHGYRFKIVTLDGQVINSGGSFTGGSSSKNSGVLSRKNEIAKIGAQLDKLESDLSRLRERLQAANAEAEKLGFDVEGEKDAISSMESDKLRFETEAERLRLSSEQLKDRVSDIEKSVLWNKNKIATSEETKTSSEIKLAELEAEISVIEGKISTAGEESAALKNRREEISNDISQKRLRSTELAKDIEAANQFIEQLKTGIESSHASATEYLDRKAELERQIAQENENIAERQHEAEESKITAERYSERIRQETDGSLEYERQENLARAKSKETSGLKESVMSEISRLSERLETIRRDSSDIIGSLWESYSMTADEAASQAEKLEDVAEANKHLTEIRNKIRALGSVNTDAVDEYKEVSERYEFLSKQLADVMKSKTELEALIDDLTVNMKRMFSESFEKINENFKVTFSELFGGGRGELRLTDPDNVLESGIEINVAPPGKVIKNLSLLSGGEQAFVAIAIYFAILMLRPSPFCILDEIEAALDDVNVTKYAQYLRHFTDTTQFILITHRRGTMEEADVLYGVTMQEKGVSKLLKMDVSDVSFSDDEIN